MTSSLQFPAQLGNLVRSRTIPSTPRQENYTKNPLQSCLFLSRSSMGLKAHPFYTRKNRYPPMESAHTLSWNNHNFTPKREYSLGSENKPLVPYNPNHSRSKLKAPQMPRANLKRIMHQSNVMNVPNQHIRQSQHFKTTYQEYYEEPNKKIRRRVRNT